MSLKRILLTEASYHKHIDKIVESIEKSLDINLSNISNEYRFIGEGAWAEVYSIKSIPDKVIRIEKTDELDSKYSDIEGLTNLKHVVRVYYNTYIESGNKDIQITVMEKLERLDEQDIRELIYIHEYYGLNVPPASWEEKSDLSGIKHVLKDIYAGVDELKKIGITHNDLHAGNVMKDPKTGNYKLIDII